MNFDKIFVFTDIDLDGVGSLLTLHWALGAKPGQIAYKATTVSNFRREFLTWLEHNSADSFDKIFFLDLDISNSADLVDRENSIIIDHHLTHVKVKDIYKKAKVSVTETSSCTKLIYNIFKDTLKITSEQKYFIALANDYDSYEFKLNETYSLNSLFTNTQKTFELSRTGIFLEKYYNGFKPFTVQENNIIKAHIAKRDKTISDLQIFKGTVKINGEDRLVGGTMGSKFVNEICDFLIKKHEVDVAFFINVDNSHVSFRKNKNCPVDVSKLATKLCEGGGHEYAAGGKITETFMNFTKLLTPI